MAAPSQPKPSPLSIGRYQLTGRAGSGIPEAHRARHPDTDDLVTVYLYPNEYVGTRRSPDRLSVMLELLTPLEHPNILRVLDAGSDGDCGYIVTEWVEGTTLARMIELHTRLPEANVIRFLAQVGQAMDFASKDETALCRISPMNVLIRNDGVAKVIPFELPGDQLTPALPMPGLPPRELTKPPSERASGKLVAFADMIFSLGTTLHESLTGQVWLPPEPRQPGRRRSRTISQRPAGLSDRTERAIRRATDPDPTKRPQSCASFLKLLRARPLTAGTPKPDIRPPSSASDNRREHVRYSLGTGANCVIHSSVFNGEPPSSEVWPLVVQDVSAGGIGILLARRCEPGTEISIELVGNTERGARSLLAKVIRVRKDQYGHWMHGCTFLTSLNEVELNALLNCMGKPETA